MLPSSLLADIKNQLDQGDRALDKDRFSKAIAFYKQALEQIPEPKHGYDISLSAFTALGEAYYFSGYFDEAIVSFKEAQKAPRAAENPLLYLRLGEAYFENGDRDSAADALARAYALDGRDVFDGEDTKYLAFLGAKIDI